MSKSRNSKRYGAKVFKNKHMYRHLPEYAHLFTMDLAEAFSVNKETTEAFSKVFSTRDRYAGLMNKLKDNDKNNS